MRSNLAGVFATAGIALGALQMLFGISALVIRFDERARSTCQRSFQLLAALIAFHLVLTTMDFHTKATGHGVETTWVLVPSALALAYLAGLIGVSRCAAARRLGAALVRRELRPTSLSLLTAIGILTVAGVGAFGLVMDYDAENPISVAGRWQPLIFDWSSGLLVAAIVGVVVGVLTVAGVQTWLIGCVGSSNADAATVEDNDRDPAVHEDTRASSTSSTRPS